MATASPQAFLAIDMGAESGRAMLGILADGRLTLHEAHRFAHRPVRLPSGLHWDLTGIWHNIQKGIATGAALAREKQVPLRSVGVDTWGVDFGLLGESGQLLGLPHCYRDARFGPVFEKTLNQIGRDRLYQATGLQFMPFNTLFQLLAMQQHEPGMLREARRLLFMPDLFHYFLTGRATNEATIASTSQMIDPRSRTWACDLLEELGLPTGLLGDTIEPGTAIGPVTDALRQELDLPEDLQVTAPAGHDTASAVAAVPADGAENWCFLSSGTWSLLGAELSEPCLSDQAMAVPFTNEGGASQTVRFLRNIAGLWLVQGCRQGFASRGQSYSYAELAEQAAAAEPFVTLVNPDHPPLLLPGDMPGRIADYARATGQPVPQTPGQFVRCCLESLALCYRHHLEQLESVLGRRFEVLHIVGGGVQNTLLNQMTASATGRRVLAGPVEATAIGNVLTQAGWDQQAAAGIRQRRTVVRQSFPTTEYLAASSGPWDAAYACYHRLVQTKD